MDKSESWRLSGSSTPVEAAPPQRPAVEAAQQALQQAAVTWPDWPLRVDAETWQRDSHDLFDYESRIVQQRGFHVSRHFRVVRIGTKVEVLMDDDYPPSTEEIVDYLLNVRIRDGRYVVAPAERAQNVSASIVPKKLWLIVKDLPHERHVLGEGDVIKLGRFRLRVKQLARQVDGEPPPELRLEDVVSDIPRTSEEDARTMQCRICLLDGGTEEDPLICPCMCKGSIKFVHVECLRHWINGKLNLTEPRVFFFRQLPCELCKSPFPCAVRFPSGEKINIVNVPLTETPFIVLENFGGGQQGLTKGMHVFSMAGKDELKLGRGHESDVRIPDVSISRYHATIRYNFGDNAFTLDDHKSKFGTLVSMRKNQALDCGDKFSVQVGRTVLKLTVDSSVRPQSEVVVLDDIKSDSADQFMKFESADSKQEPSAGNASNPAGAGGAASDTNGNANNNSNGGTNLVVSNLHSSFMGGAAATNSSGGASSHITNNALPMDSAFISSSAGGNDAILSDATGIPLNNSALVAAGGLFLSKLLYGGGSAAAASNGGYLSQLPSTVGSASGAVLNSDASSNPTPHTGSKNNHTANTVKCEGGVNALLMHAASNSVAQGPSSFDSSSIFAATTHVDNSMPTSSAFTPASVTGTDTTSTKTLFGFGLPNGTVDMRPSLAHPVNPSLVNASAVNSRVGSARSASSKASLCLNSLLRMSRESSEGSNKTGVPTAATTSGGVGGVDHNSGSGSSGSSGGGSSGLGDSASALGDTFAASPLAGGGGVSPAHSNFNGSNLAGANVPFVYLHQQSPPPWMDKGSSFGSSNRHRNIHHHPPQLSNIVSRGTASNGGSSMSTTSINGGSSNSFLDMNNASQSQQSTSSAAALPTTATVSGTAIPVHKYQQPPTASPSAAGAMMNSTGSPSTGALRYALRGGDGAAMQTMPIGGTGGVEHFDCPNMLASVNFAMLGNERATVSAAASARDQSRIAGEFV